MLNMRKQTQRRGGRTIWRAEVWAVTASKGVRSVCTVSIVGVCAVEAGVKGVGVPRRAVAGYYKAVMSQILVQARYKCRVRDDRVWVCSRREGVRCVSLVQKPRWGRISHVRFATDAGGLSRWCFRGAGSHLQVAPAGPAGSPRVPRSTLVRGPRAPPKADACRHGPSGSSNSSGDLGPWPEALRDSSNTSPLPKLSCN